MSISQVVLSVLFLLLVLHGLWIQDRVRNLEDDMYEIVSMVDDDDDN